MKRIPLTQNKFSLVDDSVFDELMAFKWHAHFDGRNFYAERKKSIGGGKQKTIKMHSVIMNPKKGMIIDHIDGNGLNNQKENLRICTKSQNGINRGKQKNNKSGFKGVYLRKNIKSLKFIAAARYHNKNIYLGTYDDAKKAAAVYDSFVRSKFGNFATLNFTGSEV